MEQLFPILRRTTSYAHCGVLRQRSVEPQQDRRISICRIPLTQHGHNFNPPLRPGISSPVVGSSTW